MTTFLKNIRQNPKILKSQVYVSNFKSRVSVSKFEWSDMPQQLLECVSNAIHGVSTCLTFFLWCAQVFCQFDNNIYY